MSTTETKEATQKLVRKNIKGETIHKLWIMSGGYCEFDGCNKFLYEDGLTLLTTNIANIAHIVAASPDGPRGDSSLPAEQRSEFKNLMLVCTDHHRLFDHEHVDKYPVAILSQFKNDHEERIRLLMSAGNYRKTTIVKLLAKIGTEKPAINENDIRKAIFPSYPADHKGIQIDLTDMEDPGNWITSANIISSKLKDIYDKALIGTTVEHVSVFALAPIPLLVHLGRCLGNKVPTHLFQRHRDTEDWRWKNGGQPASFTIKLVDEGEDPENVAVMLSLSGPLDHKKLPADKVGRQAIYEMTLNGSSPNPMFLNTIADLNNFRETYHQLLARIKTDKPGVTTIHLFPAAPSPVAIMCGRELLEKAHPTIRVYDFNKNNGNWQFALEIN